MKKLILIDGFNTFIRAYVANPALTPNGNPIGGCLGFLKCIQKYMKDENPADIIIVWDGYGGSIKKKQFFKEYKENRIPPRLNRFINNLDPGNIEENKLWQLQRLIEYLNLMPVLQIVCDYVEADDLIGYLINNDHLGKYDQKIIVSNDKDFIQLIREDVIQIRPTTEERLDINKVLELYKIHPNNWVLAKAVCGDDSDNIPGIEGCGFKTLAKRFPCLHDDEGCGTVELKRLCQEQIDKKTKVKIYSEILKTFDIVERNLFLMSLGDVDISRNCLDKILYSITNFSAEFKNMSMMKLLMEDGLMGTNFDQLKRWSNERHRLTNV